MKRPGSRSCAMREFTRASPSLGWGSISEIARNILIYAQRGEVRFNVQNDGDRSALVIVAEDHGPGIRDVELALQEGYSSSGGLGLGLPGAQRLMDEFDIRTERGKGTTITMKKWRRNG